MRFDGKTQRGNGNKNQKANHIVSAVDEAGFSLGEKRVNEKSNEITAIPELLDEITIKGHIITIDAMGTQIAIVKKIRQKRADYVLALKGKQPVQGCGTVFCRSSGFVEYNDTTVFFTNSVDVSSLGGCRVYYETTVYYGGGHSETVTKYKY